jgi:hypothetical protein
VLSPIADIHILVQRARVTWKRLAGAISVAAICLIVSFILTNVIMIAWYDHIYPHDGQSGLAAFAWGLLVAPLIALAAFVLMMLRGR